MRLSILSILTFLLTRKAGSTTSITPIGVTTNTNLCVKNHTVAVQVLMLPEANGIQCKCQGIATQDPAMREDYVFTAGVGSHKLHTNAMTWNDARKVCNEEGGHLAIINSKAEEAILVDVLNKDGIKIKRAVNRAQAFLGIHDLYKEGEWVTIFGESLFATGFAEWSSTYFGGQPDNFKGQQNCGTLLNEGGMDDVFCNDKFAFFCEIRMNC